MIVKSKPVQRAQSIILGAPGNDIGRKELKSIARRFRHLHQQRMERIQAFLAPRQRVFLKLLPLLFHGNFPTLPGFVSSATPFGIPDYTPSKATLGYAKQLSKSFIFKKRALKRYSIDAVYLMGSAGSVAYSKASDLDIWLCHCPDLESGAMHELKKKTDAVEEWGFSLGLEVHFFLIDADAFRNGEGSPISTESCGSTQHYLLLEEFYRTGLFVAGKIPVWWIVPPHQERSYSDYVAHLNGKRFVRQSDTLDFGGLELVPPEEFLGASLWHLYKAINTPYKSLLKLFLAEAYASSFPDTAWLSFELKSEVYRGTTDPEKLDPYILMYRKVENYLIKRKETDRLKLARYCFYQKVRELNNNPNLFNNASRKLLSSITSEWDDIDIKSIDERKKWSISRILEEQKAITKELLNSYRLLSQFAGRFTGNRNIGNQELSWLGRKLYSVLERKPGKIDVVRMDSAIEVDDEVLRITEVTLADDDQGWALFSGENATSPSSEDESIKKSRSLLELLAWITLNRLYRTGSKIEIETETSGVSDAELRFIRSALSKFLQSKLSDSDQLEVYADPSEVNATALFVNIGHDPMSTRQDGLQTASDRGDALSFGSMRTNLICSIDRIVLTSWQEVLIYRHLKLSGLLDCFCDVLNKAGDSLETLDFECFCFVSSRSMRIASRVKEIFEHLRQTFVRGKENASAKFILRGGEEFFVFSRVDSVVRYWNVPNESQLFSDLSSPQPLFSSVVFDNEALKTTPVPEIFKHNKPGRVQIFYCIKGQTAEIFVLDERGSLFYQQGEYAGLQFLLEPYYLFLKAVTRHYAFLSEMSIECYAVTKNAVDFSVGLIDFKPRLDHTGINIRVSADELAIDQTAYNVYCNDQEFSSMEYGKELYDQVANTIFQLRQGEQKYPIYLTDIDVPLKLLGIDVVSQLQTVHLLQYRRKIEQRLNQVE